ncbi:MAG: hypothetical protein EA379_05050 [Phycisphaerales bacterium]|nr:MAG: hypothetical protein EA379_05050 [Phycisphaerales bacterium]
MKSIALIGCVGAVCACAAVGGVCEPEWRALTGPTGTGTTAPVFALAVYDPGMGPRLYVGGSFGSAGGVTVNRIARWNGASWAALPGVDTPGVSGTVNALAVYDDGSGPALYVGGAFTEAGGVTVNRIARWNGASWSALSSPGGVGVPSGVITAMTVHDDGNGPALYVGGSFATIGGVTANGVARWDGSSWSALTGPGGTGVSGSVMALAGHNDGNGAALYVGGSFVTAGGVTVSDIAKWDGAAWSALPGPGGVGVSGGFGSVQALASHDDGNGPALFVGGGFASAGGVEAHGAARWDGASWSAMSGPSGNGMLGSQEVAVYEFAVVDDGSGPSLFATGEFDVAGGVQVNGIARWRGAGWSALEWKGGVGVGDTIAVHAMAQFDDGEGPALFAGGLFFGVGDPDVPLMVNRIARWACHVESACPGDYNGDNVVDFEDLSIVLGDFGGAYGFDDLSAVLANFGEDCG